MNLTRLSLALGFVWTICAFTSVSAEEKIHFAWSFREFPETTDRCRLRAENIGEALQRNGHSVARIDSNSTTGVALLGIDRMVDALFVCAEKTRSVVIVVHGYDTGIVLGMRDRLRRLWEDANLTTTR
jgi:hypothetical protein